MKAEIISIGTELLLGHTINTDAAIVARELASLGIDMMNVQMVGDNRDRLLDALALAASRSDLIITTGGLGPTEDDLTKSAIASFAGVDLKINPEAEKTLAEYFGGRKMSANQIRQAYLPQGALMLPNDVGTAPGCAVEARGRIIIMLPGPPAELKPMWENYARPFLEKRSKKLICSHIARAFGIGEGMAAEKIDALVNGSNPTVATYAKGGEMFIKVTAKADSIQAADALCSPVMEKIRECLGDVIYGIDVPSLEALVVEKLIANDLTIATAESCTGGLVAKRITDIPGASAVFHLGLVTYSNQEKEKMLSVPHEMLSTYGAVSPQVASCMARNIRDLANADFGIGISGIAGPDGGTPEKPVGLVYIAVADEKGAHIRRMQPQGRYLGRDWVRERAASHALDMVRRLMQGLPVDLPIY